MTAFHCTKVIRAATLTAVLGLAASASAVPTVIYSNIAGDPSSAIPGGGTWDWDEIFATLAAIGFHGGLAMESFINMPPEIAHGLSVWRPVADSAEEVIGQGLPFLRGKAAQYGLISRGDCG